MTISSVDDFPELAGIYKFKNKTNNKIYIGESMNFKKRMSGHVGRAKDLNWTAVISRAFRKYGFSNFEYSIVESYALGSVTKAFLLEREAFYIKTLDAMNPEVGYNRCPYGANTIGYKFSEESRKKMSVSRKKRVMKRESIEKQAKAISGEKNCNYGIPITQERKDLLLAARIAKGVTMEERLSKSAGHIKSENKPRKPIYQLDKDTGEILHAWRSLSDAVRHLGRGSRCDISRSTLFPHKTAYGFKWRFLTEEEKKEVALETCYKDEPFQCPTQTRYKKRFLK